jgi:hypothetical protein
MWNASRYETHDMKGQQKYKNIKLKAELPNGKKWWSTTELRLLERFNTSGYTIE